MKRIFIDGSAGTTGLRIVERMEARSDLRWIRLSESERKDPTARAQAIRESDVTFLCLPDAAAREAVAMAEGADTILLDTSTAHRTDPRFVYGFPELDPSFEEKIRASKRIAVPGCHASGFIALLYPLVKAGIVPKDSLLTCTSLTGYSGGGKSMIAAYEAEDRDGLLDAPRQYGLTQMHKHLKEMTAITGLSAAPAFLPIVADYYSGMEVTVPLFASQIRGTATDIRAIYREQYQGPLVRYEETMDENGFMAAGALSGKDTMQITVSGNDDRILLIARYDNLGKGASGAAIECFNLVTEADPVTGLVL